MKKTLLYFFTFIFVMFFATKGVQAAWQAATGESGSANMLITASAVYSAALLALFVKFRWAVLSSAWFRTADKSVFFWAAIAAAGTLLPFTWLQEFLPELDESTSETYRSIVHAPLGYIALCLFAPFVEETVFRGAMLRSLLGTKLKPWAAVTISAALFAAAHISPAQMPHAFITGLLLGWMYFRTGSILPGVAFHWANNTIVYAIVALTPQMENMTLSQIFGSDMHVAIALACSLCILCPALFQLHLRMKKSR